MKFLKVPLSRSFRAVTLALLVVSVSACASAGGKRKTGPYEQLMTNAEAEVSAGRIESALSAFNDAAMANPTRKEPWVRSAQLQFDAGNYGRAIVAAEEVLKRDPSDLVADSVLTVSGLRVAAESLKRLQASGAITSDTARREAEQLRATMAATMGSEFMASGSAEPKSKPKPKPRAKPRSTPKAPAAQQEPVDNNPFD